MTPPTEYRDEERLDLASASMLHILIECPGMLNLKKALPWQALATQAQQDEKDESTKRGDRIHKAFETGNTLPLSEDEVEDYKKGVRFNQMIVENWVKSKALTGYKEGPREMRVFLHHPLTLEPLCSAKPDRHYVSGQYMLVTDLKTGFCPNLPASPGSWQLKLQAIALQRSEYPQVTDIRVAYVKAKDEYSVWDVCDYTQQDIEYSVQSICFHVWESTQPEAPRHAGNHCNWCPCKAWCPEAGAFTMLPKVMTPAGQDVEQRVAMLAPQSLYKIWDASTVITKILDAVKLRLKAMPAEELAALGLMLPEHGRKADEITDIVGAFQFLTSEFMTEDVLACMEFSKTKLVDLAVRDKGMTKLKAAEWCSTALDKFITRGFTAPAIKRLKE